MLISEFDKMKFYAGMRFLCKPMDENVEATVETIISANFDQKLIATIPDNAGDDDHWNWWRCENCDLVINDGI